MFVLREIRRREPETIRPAGRSSRNSIVGSKPEYLPAIEFDHRTRLALDEIAIGVFAAPTIPDQVASCIRRFRQDIFRSIKQCRLDTPVERPAQLDETCRLPGGQHRKLQIEFLLLFAVQVEKHGILKAIEGDREELTLFDIHLNGQRPIEEPWRMLESARLEIPATPRRR